MKRFTDTAKWDDPWFRQLPGVHKLLFLYVIDRCNNAGFWEVDEEAISWHTKVEVKHLQGAWKGLERGIKGASGWVWVRRFLRHQKNDELNPSNPAHKQIIQLIQDQVQRFGECAEFLDFIAPYKGLLSPIGIGTVQVQKKGVRGKQVVRPTIEQALEYGKQIDMPPDQVQSWFDYFQSNGWKVGGRAPMKDWQAAMRNGKRNARHGTNGTKPSAFELKTRLDAVKGEQEKLKADTRNYQLVSGNRVYKPEIVERLKELKTKRQEIEGELTK